MLSLICSNVEAMMHGVSRFTLRGRHCTAIYSDGSKETAEIPEALAKPFADYVAYQMGDINTPCDAPNSFSLVAAIQSKRIA